MTVASDTSSVKYTGDGAATVFPTTFKFLDNSHVVVKVTAGNATVTKTLGIDYTLTGAGSDLGGNVTLFTAPEVGDTITIERTVPYTQTTSFQTQGSFAPKVHEAEFDKSVMIDQQLHRRLTALESGGLPTTAIAGNGLVAAGDTWSVGAGGGIIATADAVEVDFGEVADLVAVDAAAAGAGVLNEAARADHKHTANVGIAVAVQAGVAAGAGVATTLSRSDHIHNISTAAPAAGAVAIGNAAAEGAAASLARSDHTHTVAAGVPVTLGVANAEGAATTFARSNHVHAHGAQTDSSLHAVATTAANGFMAAADKTALSSIADGAYGGQVTTVDATATVVAARDTTANSVEVHEVRVAGCRSTLTQGAGYVIVGTFRNEGGVVTQIGVTTVVSTHESDAAWAVDFAVSANQVQVKVTGVAATTIKWSANGRVTVATP